MKIFYACAWDKNKKKTWSGTSYSLYKSLNKKIEVIDYDMNLNKIEKLLVLLTSIEVISNKIVLSTFYSKVRDYFNSLRSRKISKIDNELPVLFVGCLSPCDNKSYAYIDLSLDYILDIKKTDKKIFNYSSFQNMYEKDLIKKRNFQMGNFKNIQGIFTMSKWLAEHLVNYSKIPPEKVHAVGGGINLDLGKIKSVKKDNNKVLFVGRDFYRKGGDLVYKAFKIAKKSNPNIKLYVAGPKEWPMEDKDENLIFLGDIDSDELSRYYNMCDIFCMPSRFEAYGLVFIEALVYGLPCIGRNAFAMKEFIQDGENGYLIDDDNANILASKILDLLTNDAIKENVVSKKAYYISEYSWDTVANRIIEVIKNDSK